MPSESRRSHTPKPPAHDPREMTRVSYDQVSISKKRSSLSIDEKYARKSLDAESTMYAASTLGGMSVTKSFQSLGSGRRDGRPSSYSSSYEDLSASGRFSRNDLAKILGDDAEPHDTEVDTIPCAGLRIGFGRLRGLMAWRFVVRYPGIPTPRSPAVIGNFILDTGAQSSRVAPEILTALGHKGVVIPGEPIKLAIQGVEHECVIAEYGEASRLSADYLIDGSLALHFAWRMDAPVLSVESSKSGDVPRTVSKIQAIQEKVKSLFQKVRPLSKLVDTPTHPINL